MKIRPTLPKKLTAKLPRSLRTGSRSGEHPLKRVSRHPAFAIPAITGLFIIMLTVIGIIVFSGGTPKLRQTDTHIVIINHDKTEQTLPTRAHTVSSVLKKANIAIHQGDVVEPDLDSEVVTDNFRINVYRAVPVTIVDGNRKTFAFSAAATPRSIVKQSGINVYPEDKLDLLPTDNFLTEASIGQRVVIQRATAVNVNIYGTPVQMRTHAKTVGELLKERGLKLQANDSVQPAVSTPLTAAMQVFVLRKGTQIATEEIAIPMTAETIEDASLTFGTTAVRQQGSDGRKLVTYQLQLENGKEVSRKIIQEVITVQPVTQITARGKNFNPSADKLAVMQAAGIAASDYPYVDYIVSRESGWCPTKWQGQSGYCPPSYVELHPPSSSYGYGLVQSTPAIKMSSAGGDWQTNPVTQLRWATSYAARYGGWAGAYNQWISKHYW
jgi:uncharacterized protein YabE (DUF348 family)